ncbi:hypothetical protein [Peribacillus sp. TH14]|uniref:hypothetical protein n=1 Tax=Peribacillus sp. TH14 TaxID=2798481 RepID=UPI001913499D|nr:glycogen branching protein [Peribacillus sp. TH14]MBK5501364.1 glycogen branching protein [Peribacillus sp. TH14]
MFVEQSRLNIKFGVTNVKISESMGRKGVQVYEYIEIVLVNKNNYREVPHPITSFIYDKWRFTSVNNQLARAKQLTPFLNYVFIECSSKYRLKSFSDLKIEHGVHFLEYKRKQGCSRSTIDSYDSTLKHFYEYLSRNGGLNHFNKDDFKGEGLKSLFKQHMASLPAPKLEDDKARRLEDHHIIPFIYTAIRVADDIALGIYFSIFGGLRGSEVMSIKRSEIKKLGVYGEHGLIVKLKTDAKHAKGSGNRVKSPGVQPIDAVKQLLSSLYKSHLDRYPEPIDGSNSLFVNAWGTAMQYQTYHHKFKKVKEAFIETLINSDNPDDKLYALNYKSLNWSTHIGRGTYSNNIAEECNHLVEIMRARRDKSPQSVLPYLMHTQKSIKQLNDDIDEMFEGDAHSE